MNRPTLRTIARLLAPWRTIRRLEATVQRLHKALANPMLTGIAIGKETGITAGMKGSGPQLLAGMFLGLLEESGKDAPNYLELSFDTPKGVILVTVTQPGGATPHGLRVIAEQEARNLRAELETAKEALRRLQRWGGYFSKGFDCDIARGVRSWLEGGMTGPLPPLPQWLVDREAKASSGEHH